jgi:hypothetical protein
MGSITSPLNVACGHALLMVVAAYGGALPTPPQGPPGLGLSQPRASGQQRPAPVLPPKSTEAGRARGTAT